MSNEDQSEEKETIRLMKGLHLTKPQLALALVGLVVVLLVPEIEGFFDNLQLDTFHNGILWGMAALGLALLLNKTELVSFGHAAFFGGGAYGGAMLVNFVGVDSGLLILFAAVFFSTAMAFAIGWFVADYVAIYFALLTLAFGQLLYAIAIGSPTLGQDEGLRLRSGGEASGDPPSLFGIEFTLQQQGEYRLVLYYFTILLLIASMIVMYRIMKSPFGSALEAIGQNRTRARFIGIPVERYVWGAFTISGFYGGIAGGLYGLRQLSIGPEGTLYVFVSGEILFMAILGGFQTIIGPIIGGIVLTFLLDNVRFLTEHFELIIGILLLLVVFVLPKGIWGSSEDIKNGLMTRVKNPAQLGADVGTLQKMLINAVRNAITTIKIILFGVK